VERDTPDTCLNLHMAPETAHNRLGIRQIPHGAAWEPIYGIVRVGIHMYILVYSYRYGVQGPTILYS
jgi:hypothetical protein